MSTNQNNKTDLSKQKNSIDRTNEDSAKRSPAEGRSVANDDHQDSDDEELNKNKMDIHSTTPDPTAKHRKKENQNYHPDGANSSEAMDDKMQDEAITENSDTEDEKSTNSSNALDINENTKGAEKDSDQISQ